jgi:hypothetical protein
MELKTKRAYVMVVTSGAALGAGRHYSYDSTIRQRRYKNEES